MQRQENISGKCDGKGHGSGLGRQRNKGHCDGRGRDNGFGRGLAGGLRDGSGPKRAQYMGQNREEVHQCQRKHRNIDIRENSTARCCHR